MARRANATFARDTLPFLPSFGLLLGMLGAIVPVDIDSFGMLLLKVLFAQPLQNRVHRPGSSSFLVRRRGFLPI